MDFAPAGGNVDRSTGSRLPVRYAGSFPSGFSVGHQSALEQQVE
jgi:hypothetical protein